MHTPRRGLASLTVALGLAVTLGLTPAAASPTAVPSASVPATSPARTAPPPQLADPSRTGARLAERFLGLLKAKDTAGLERFLSPAFQVQRADGSGASRADYLAALPTVREFVVSDAVGTQDGGTLVVRYLATVNGVTNGKEYTAGAAPRLSTFTWDGRRWQLASHANFNPLQGEATTPGVKVLLDRAMATVLDQPLAYPTQTPAQLSSSILTLAPGQQTGWHYHDAPLYAYVMSGTVTVTYDGGITKSYPAGTAIVEALGTHHNGQNLGTTDAVLVVVNIGAEGVANTVRL